MYGHSFDVNTDISGSTCSPWPGPDLITVISLVDMRFLTALCMCPNQVRKLRAKHSTQVDVKQKTVKKPGRNIEKCNRYISKVKPPGVKGKISSIGLLSL